MNTSQATTRNRASLRPEAFRLPVNPQMTRIRSSVHPDRSPVDILSDIAGGDPDTADDLHVERLALVWSPSGCEIVRWDPPCDLVPVEEVTT